MVGTQQRHVSPAVWCLRSTLMSKPMAARLSVAALIAVTWAIAAPQVTEVVHAYNLEGCKYKTMPVAYGNSGSGDYYSAFNAAANSWTNTPTNVWLQLGGANSTLQLFTENDGNTGHDGWSTYDCVGGYMLDGRAASNTNYTNGYNFWGKQQVMAHEVGHLLGLAHNNPALCSVPIMYYSSARYFTCGFILPQQDDINGVKSLYG